MTITPQKPEIIEGSRLTESDLVDKDRVYANHYHHTEELRASSSPTIQPDISVGYSDVNCNSTSAHNTE